MATVSRTAEYRSEPHRAAWSDDKRVICASNLLFHGTRGGCDIQELSLQIGVRADCLFGSGGTALRKVDMLLT